MVSEKRGIYQGLSLPVSLIDEVKKHIEKRPQYKGVTEFVRKSIREKMDKENKISSGMSTNLTENDIVSIVNRVLAHGYNKMK
jgi:Arc/MetJ-type ribon-helix-helix transcriptional regulator